MNKHFVISALGQDKPGIVNSLSKNILDFGGNITDSRMSVLGDEFALVMLIMGSDEAISNIEKSLPGIQDSLGLTIISKQTDPRVSEERRLPYCVSVVSMDNPGIVHDVTSFLSDRGINVEELSTSTYSAAHTGAPMFSLDLNISLPADVNISRLRSDFLSFCDGLNLDARLEAVVK